MCVKNNVKEFNLKASLALISFLFLPMYESIQRDYTSEFAMAQTNSHSMHLGHSYIAEIDKLGDLGLP